MNNDNNEELVKSVDKLTKQIEKINQKIVAIVFIVAAYLFGIHTLRYDYFGYILAFSVGCCGTFILLRSI
jgi:hypothetical protein